MSNQQNVSFVVKTIIALCIITQYSAAYSQTNSSTSSLEEVIITGTHIRDTPVGAMAPVSVINRSDMENFGSPSVIEILRNLSVSSGIDGESNQFGSNALEGTSNINLRGLGSGRTLVLLNGRRQTFSPRPISDQQMLFVDTNQMPSVAIRRVEILKDGAVATYGSDAIAGVVNFITRDNFEGVEVTGSYKHIDDSDGDYDIGLIFGIGSETTNWVTSLGFNHRSKLQIKDSEFALKSFSENPEGGWSLIGNPPSIFSPGLSAAGHPLPFVADPNCEALGGVSSDFGSGSSVCRFQFTYFDNIVEDEDRAQIFSEISHDVNDSLTLHAEALYAKTDIDHWNTSPSYPPQVLVDFSNRFVPTTHPGWIDMVAQFPALAANVVPAGALIPGIFPASNGVAYVGRVAGVEGPAQEGTREHETIRMAIDINGTLKNGLGFDSGLSYSKANFKERTPDVQIYKLANALRGFGGANCDPSDPTAIAGAGGCEYFNPFSNSIAFSAVTGNANPSFNSNVANSAALKNWLFDEFSVETTTELLTADFTLDGEISSWTLSGGNVGFATGIQARFEHYDRDPSDIANLNITPCPTPGDTNCTTPTGPFGFLSGTLPMDEEQEIYALYTELAIPVYENLNVQLAIRYEDYGSSVGDTIDPKVATRWQVSENFALRGSVSTSFRGPTLNQLRGSFTTLSFIPAASAFKAVETVGNPNLEPESATTFNIGAILELFDNSLFATLDYWSFDFDDPIIVEPFEAVLATNLPGQVIRNATTGSIERIIANIINGPNIKNSGYDLVINYSPSDTWTYRFETTYISQYEVEEYNVNGTTVFEAFSPVGQLNTTNFVRPLPRIKAKASAELKLGQHNINGVINYVHSYNDERANTPGNTTFATLSDGQQIDSHVTIDINYNFQFKQSQTRLNISIINLTDEEPPFARLDINYDPFTHSPLGRTLKFTAIHKFGS